MFEVPLVANLSICSVISLGYSLIMSSLLQMMSTGCSMVPMMYPGIPQYMPTMGMNMGIGMNMEMSMNQPMNPYPQLMPGPATRNAAAAAQIAPQYPLPAYHLSQFPAPDPSRTPVANQPDPPQLNSHIGHNVNQPRLPNFSDPYHQYFGLQQAQLMLPQASPFSCLIYLGGMKLKLNAVRGIMPPYVSESPLFKGRGLISSPFQTCIVS